MTGPAVLTIEEAARELRIGRTAAYMAARRGDIPTVRIGRALRVPRVALNRMLGLENDESPAAEPGSRRISAGRGRHASG